MRNTTPLFIAQSCADTWDDYMRSITKERFVCWDYIVLTASNEQQAEGFRAQLAEREKAGLLPKRTHFAVIPDPKGKRVGSGGATLGVIRYIVEHSGRADLKGLRILVIHSGGDSKRVPQYSALGKLFSPVPRELPNGRISTLFDEFLIAMSSVPSRIREGMLLLSGDVLLLFNPLQIDYSGQGAAAISFKEKVETGKNHGVFLRGEDGNIKKFLHKQTVQTLQAQGAVNEQGAVDIDTGAIIFSAEILSALYSLLCKDGVLDETLYQKYVNETVRLSLYGDFVYPLASEATLEEFYQEKPEGEYCDELKAARTEIWRVLRPFRMKLLRLAPAKFIHFGTTAELMHLMSEGITEYTALDWSHKVGSSIHNDTAGYNSILSSRATIGEGCYLEVSYVHKDAVVGNNVLLSYVDIHDETIPSNVVLHGLKQKDGRFVARIYGIHDNPKDTLEGNATFMTTTLAEFMRLNGIEKQELWQDANHSLWTAQMYPSCTTITEAVAAALNLYEMAQGRGDVAAWRKTQRKSLCSGFNDADPYAIITWDKRMQELVRMDRLAKLISTNGSADQAKQVLAADGALTKIQKQWLEKRLETADISEKIRLYYYIGKALDGTEADNYIGKCFETIQAAITQSSLKTIRYREDCRIVCDRHVVQMPLRVNWGGGWSDTPPYCNEQGGTVLNVAILLNGQKPVEVTLERLQEHKIIFDSRDMDVHGEFTSIEQLQRTGDPYDPFALQKAALIACGIIPVAGGNLEQILTRLGGGFRMNSEVTNVPKGSGLGTSSILAGACVKGLLEFMGVSYSTDDLYSHVLCMEQIMATGGGWQDQVGGLSEGIKYITTMPGWQQNIKVQYLELAEETKQELNQRFTLIYTGQRRLARNLLRDVVGRYVGNQPDSLYALNEIQRLAALMRFELERGNVDEFAKLLNLHWELSQKVDKGSTNTLIEQIFLAVEDMIAGRMICGAGGGGFLQVVLKKDVTKEMLHQRLKTVFQDNEVDAWQCELMI